MSALSVSSFVGDAAHTSAVDVLAVGNGVIDGSASVFSSQIVGEVAHSAGVGFVANSAVVDARNRVAFASVEVEEGQAGFANR